MISFTKYGLDFRSVNVNDAQFILDLRLEERVSKFLSKTENDLPKQQKWILDYQSRENEGSEYYFLTENKEGISLGLNRIYNIQDQQFEIGSWIYLKNIHIKYPILGDLGTRDYGFEQLGLKYCVFNVRKENKSVIKYHLSFNANIINEDDLNLFFQLDYDNYKIKRDQLLKKLL